MPAAQDHKRLLDDDDRPEHGRHGRVRAGPAGHAGAAGDGAAGRASCPPCAAWPQEGAPYVGVLYAGLMLTDDGPKVLEFNCRFGDPETQVILPLLESDLLAVMNACVDGTLAQFDVQLERPSGRHRRRRLRRISRRLRDRPASSPASTRPRPKAARSSTPVQRSTNGELRTGRRPRPRRHRHRPGPARRHRTRLRRHAPHPLRRTSTIAPTSAAPASPTASPCVGQEFSRTTAMPKRDDIHSILIIGSGPIVIGQACEFDYSGAQACKALRQEGYRVVLVNSNPATIMTDPEMADATYVEPLTVDIVEKIIEKEKPDALLPTVGGQTGLNLSVALAEAGVLDRHGVELIGANLESMQIAEDRERFKKAMDAVGLESPRSGVARTLEEAQQDRAGRHRPLSHLHPPQLHPGRQRRGHCLHAPGVRGEGAVGPQGEPRAYGPRRRVADRLEGIRAGGDARPRRQLRRRLHHREPGRHGRAHRRQHHRRARADAHRQGIPAPARPGAARHARRRRGDRRQQRPVRRRSRSPVASSSSR